MSRQGHSAEDILRVLDDADARQDTLPGRIELTASSLE
jgi:hypothetical protein